jgi:hypothetical protein
MLQIQSGGKLVQIENDIKDITDISYHFLFEECTLAEDVTLKDIFLLLNKNLDSFHTLFGYWCKEFTQEALSGIEPKDKNVFDYLELYNIISINEEKIENIGCVDLHAMQNGEPYSLSFLNVYEYVHLPLKIGKTKIYLSGSDNNLVLEKNSSFKLGNILYGIIWELSFYGPPVERNAKKKELIQILEEETK